MPLHNVPTLVVSLLIAYALVLLGVATVTALLPTLRSHAGKSGGRRRDMASPAAGTVGGVS